jgi:two-component system, OmpR family, sensor histidine kinase MprB
VSLRARIACIVALLVGLTVALTSGVAYFTVRGEVYHQVDLDLIAQAGRAKTLRPEMLVSPDANVLLGAADLRIALLVQDPHDGDVTAVSSPKQTPPISVRERQVAEGSRDSSLRTTSWHGDRYRVVATPAPSGYTIVLARPLAPTDRTLARLAWVIFLTGGAGILLAAAAGLAVTRAGLRPVERLTAKAEHVAHTGDLTPIEVTGRDELARLTASFNTMLDAVAKAQARQRQLVADASHELRTPMTSLRTNLDLLAQASTEGGLSELDRNELVADVRAQLEELSGLVNDLVELAREEPPQYSAEPVELSDVASRSVERVRRRAPGLKYDLDLRGAGRAADPRAGRHQPGRQRRQVEPGGRHDHDQADQRHAVGGGRGPGHRRRGPAEGVRPVLPVRRGQGAARIRAGAGDRQAGRRAARRLGRGGPRARRRGAVQPVAARYGPRTGRLVGFARDGRIALLDRSSARSQ